MQNVNIKMTFLNVIPAKAGIQVFHSGFPITSGMTDFSFFTFDF